MTIVVDTEACYSCRICELACSFHHAGFFSPQLSSIRVSRDNQTAEIRWSISSTCDSCKGEVQPLCVEYCAYGALREAK